LLQRHFQAQFWHQLQLSPKRKLFTTLCFAMIIPVALEASSILPGYKNYPTISKQFQRIFIQRGRENQLFFHTLHQVDDLVFPSFMHRKMTLWKKNWDRCHLDNGILCYLETKNFCWMLQVLSHLYYEVAILPSLFFLLCFQELVTQGWSSNVRTMALSLMNLGG